MANTEANWQTFLRWERSADGEAEAEGYDFEERIRGIWNSRTDHASIALLLRDAQRWHARNEDERQKLNPRMAAWQQDARLRKHDPTYGLMLLRARNDCLELFRASLLRLQQRLDSPLFDDCTTPQSRAFANRLLKETESEYLNVHRSVVFPAARNFFPDFDKLPQSLRHYILDALDEVSFQNPRIITETGIVDQIHAETRTVSTYGNAPSHDWGAHKNPRELILERRQFGSIQCQGHPSRTLTATQISERENMLSAWGDFDLNFKALDDDLKWVPNWAVNSAAKRAELLYDHTGIAVWPPEDELDDEYLQEVLTRLEEEENRYSARAEVIHEDFEVHIDNFLQESGYKSNVTPYGRRFTPLPIPSWANTSGLHADLLNSSRRAWQHSSEKDIRQMIVDGNSAEAVLSATFQYYENLMNFDYQDANPRLKSAARARLKCEYLALVAPTGQPRSQDRSWVMAGLVGNQQTSTTSLWLRFDKDDQVTKRVVSKDSYPSGDEWNDVHYWRPKGVPKTQQIPREAYFHARFRNFSSQKSNIVGYQGHHIFWTHRLLRIYTDYCSLGSLADITSRLDWDSPKHISDSLMWSLFEALAQASYALRYGPPKSFYRARWEGIVHQNVAPWNILATEHDQAAWRGLPAFRLADFGRATDDQMRSEGAPGYRAPEQNPVHGGTRLLTEATNVWCCGNIIRDLMGDKYATYPEVLRILVDDCLQERQISRPSVLQLLARIKSFVDPAAPPPTGLFRALFESLRRHLVGRPPPDTYKYQDFSADRPPLRDDDYKLGAARSDLTRDDLSERIFVEEPEPQRLGTIRGPNFWQADSGSP